MVIIFGYIAGSLLYYIGGWRLIIVNITSVSPRLYHVIEPKPIWMFADISERIHCLILEFFSNILNSETEQNRKNFLLTNAANR